VPSKISLYLLALYFTDKAPSIIFCLLADWEMYQKLKKKKYSQPSDIYSLILILSHTTPKKLPR
jgi:hypothetical protein